MGRLFSNSFLFFLSVGFSFLSGCSNYFKVVPLENIPSGNQVDGVLYYLPQKEFEIELTRQIKSCEINKQDKFSPKIDFGVKVTDRNIADTTSAYVIKYRSLDSKTKTIELTVDLNPNGTLKSINNEISDKTREIVSNTVSGLIKIAKTALMPASSLPISTPSGSSAMSFKEDESKIEIPYCTEEVKTALGNLDKLVKEKKDKEKEIKVKQKEIDEAKPEKQGSLKSELDKLKGELSDIVDALSKELEVTTDMQIYIFRPSDNKNSLILKPNPKLLNRWFVENKNFIKRCGENGNENECKYIPQEDKTDLFCSNDADINTCKADFKYLNAYAQLALTKDEVTGKVDKFAIIGGKVNVEEGRVTCNDNSDKCVGTVTIKKGDFRCKDGTENCKVPASQENSCLKDSRLCGTDWLVYRQPTEGILRICHEESCDQVKASDRLFDKNYVIPQSGQKMILPLKNGPFEDKTLSAEFSAEGGLTKFTYKSSASGVAASAMFKETVEAAVKLSEEKRKANDDAINQETKRIQAEKNKISAEIELINKRKELNSLKAE